MGFINWILSIFKTKEPTYALRDEKIMSPEDAQKLIARRAEEHSVWLKEQADNKNWKPKEHQCGTSCGCVTRELPKCERPKVTYKAEPKYVEPTYHRRTSRDSDDDNLITGIIIGNAMSSSHHHDSGYHSPTFGGGDSGGGGSSRDYGHSDYSSHSSYDSSSSCDSGSSCGCDGGGGCGGGE